METARKMAPIDAPPSSAARMAWDRAVNRARDLDSQVFGNGLRLAALGFTFAFAARSGVALPSLSPDLEVRFAKLQADNEELKNAVRKVEDREWGARWNGRDFDIVIPQAGLSGIFIPIAIGVGIVALAGLITRLAYLEDQNKEISRQFNALLDSTDETLCSDPSSPACVNWQIERKASGYEKQRSFADSISSAASTVGAGLGKGLMIALPLVALAIFWKR
ncbi:MAG: hypothetical protein PHT59_04225 [Candidatus Omnitrophica bacterium]|nr:hypothetical protein [Candidatus Omnitrophota bacterium]